MSVGTEKAKALWPPTCHGRWMSPEYEEGLVSVIIPTYNRAHFLTEAMDSVRAQTYRPIELIVVDDGSTDSTPQVLEEWGKAHSDDRRFELRTFHQENKGACAARNLGLIESRGEFIQFLDSDDLLGARKIAVQVQALSCQAERTGIYGSSRTFRGQRGSYEVHSGAAREAAEPLRQWLRGGFALSHAILWSRSEVLSLGPWDESLAADQDGEYGMRFLVSGGRLVYCPSAWAYYRSHTNQTGRLSTGNSREFLQSRMRVAQRVEQMLVSSGMLSMEYRAALGRRYYMVARRAALVQPDLARSCLQDVRRLLRGRELTRELIYSSLASLFGLLLAESMFRVLGYGRRLRRSMRPLSIVRSQKELRNSSDDIEARDPGAPLE